MSWKRPNSKTRMKPLLNNIPNGGSTDLYIDLGTGDGLFAELLTEKFPNSLILCSDLRRTTSMLFFNLSDVRYIPFRGRCFAGIILAQVLHYLPYSVHFVMLKKLFNTLKVNGWLLIIEYDEQRSSSWLPYPIRTEYLDQLGKSLGLKVEAKVCRINDGNRPKFSYLIQF